MSIHLRTMLALIAAGMIMTACQEEEAPEAETEVIEAEPGAEEEPEEVE